MAGSRAARAAAARQTRDGTRRDDDGANEVVVDVSDVDAPRAINRDAGGTGEHCRAAKAISVATVTTRAATTRQSRHGARCDDNSTDNVVASVSDVDAASAINSDATWVSERRRAAKAICVAGRNATRAAAARQSRDSTRRDDDGADEIVVEVCDVDVARVSNRDAGGLKEGCRATETISTAACNAPHAAATRQSRDGARRDDDGADEVVVHVSNIDATNAINRDAVGKSKGRRAAEAISMAACGPARAAAARQGGDGARGDDDGADEVVVVVSDVDAASAYRNAEGV